MNTTAAPRPAGQIAPDRPRRAEDAAPAAAGRWTDRTPPPAPRRVESVTGCHQFSPPRDTLKDARRRCFAAVFSSFCRGLGCFGGIFPGFLAILTAEKIRFFGLFFLFLPFSGPPARYWGGRFFHSRVRKPENFLGIGAFLHFPGGGSEKVRGDFFGKIFKMIHCDTLFRV